MLFNKLSLLLFFVSSVLAVPAGVTVTQYVHRETTVIVKGYVYFTNGQTLTTYYTDNGDVPTTTTVAAAAQITAQPTIVAEGTTVFQSTSKTPMYASVSTISSTFTSTTAGIVVSVSIEQETDTTSTLTPTSFTTTVGSTIFVSSATSISTSATSNPSTSTYTASIPSTSILTSTGTIADTVVSASIEQEAATTTTLAPTSSSTSVSSTTSVTTNGLSDNASTLLSAHNNKRALHKDTPSLTWSSELETYAQNYADQYDCSGTLVHSGGPYGENLALGYGIEGAVDAWYDEIKYYNYNDPGFSEKTGHFTQVVWKSSTEVGCGIKYCGSTWGDYVVCSYKPAGNVIGEFPENVMPLA